jgi:hypothetical protein
MRSLAREWPEGSAAGPAWAAACCPIAPEGSVGQQLAAQLPWFHTCTLLEKVKRPREAALVRAEDGRERVEPELARDPRRARALRGSGRSPDELRDHAPGPAVRPLAREALKDPLQARLPRHCRRRRGARDRTRARSAHPRLPARARPRVRVRREPGPRFEWGRRSSGSISSSTT